jgi:hypothetical protein
MQPSPVSPLYPHSTLSTLLQSVSIGIVLCLLLVLGLRTVIPDLTTVPPLARMALLWMPLFTGTLSAFVVALMLLQPRFPPLHEPASWVRFD